MKNNKIMVFVIEDNELQQEFYKGQFKKEYYFIQAFNTEDTRKILDELYLGKYEYKKDGETLFLVSIKDVDFIGLDGCLNSRELNTLDFAKEMRANVNSNCKIIATSSDKTYNNELCAGNDRCHDYCEKEMFGFHIKSNKWAA